MLARAQEAIGDGRPRCRVRRAIVANATRCGLRPPERPAPRARRRTGRARRARAAARRESSRRRRPSRSALSGLSRPAVAGRFGFGLRRRLGGERDRARHGEQAQQHGDRKRRGRERDDDAGDQQRLRHRVAAHARRRAAARDGAEQQEDAAAHDVEREDLAQRMRVHDEAVGADADEQRGAEAEERAAAHRRTGLCGAPVSSSARISASVGISASSMTMMSGFA